MIEERIYQDYIQALKLKNKQKTVFLSFIRAELKNKSINLKKDKLDNSEALIVLKQQQKRLIDSKESIIASGRNNLIHDVEQELALLAEYLPTPLTEDQLSAVGGSRTRVKLKIKRVAGCHIFKKPLK